MRIGDKTQKVHEMEEQKLGKKCSERRNNFNLTDENDESDIRVCVHSEKITN